MQNTVATICIRKFGTVAGQFSSLTIRMFLGILEDHGNYPEKKETWHFSFSQIR